MGRTKNNTTRIIWGTRNRGRVMDDGNTTKGQREQEEEHIVTKGCQGDMSTDNRSIIGNFQNFLRTKVGLDFL